MVVDENLTLRKDNKMKIRVWVTLLVIFSIVSFKLGIDFGIYQFIICDAPSKAYLTTLKLDDMKKQKYEHIEAEFQMDLSTELFYSGKYLSHGVPFLLVPFYDLESADSFINSRDRETFIKKAAKYRKENPTEPLYDLSDCKGDNIDENCEYAIKQQNYYDKAMEIK